MKKYKEIMTEESRLEKKLEKVIMPISPTPCYIFFTNYPVVNMRISQHEANSWEECIKWGGGANGIQSNPFKLTPLGRGSA